MLYNYTERREDGKSGRTGQIEINSGAYDDAAYHAIRKMTRRTKIHARRVTGEPGKSGIFQGYVGAGLNSLTSYGNPVHVWEAGL
jgi:hypothetical protein